MDFKRVSQIFLVSCTMFNVICSQDPSIQPPKVDLRAKPRVKIVNWVCAVSGEPDIIWFNPHGEEAINGSKYSMVNLKATHIRFFIHNVTLDDNGIYVIEATKGAWKKVLRIPLTVEGEPNIELAPYTYYKPGNHATMKMNVTGLPFPPRITCSYFACPDSLCEGQPLELVEMEINKWKRTYSMDLEPVLNGSIVCTAENPFYKNQPIINNTTLIPSNAAELFVVDIVQPTIKDNVELICDLPFTYGSNLTWSNHLGDEINKSDTRYEIRTAKTNISHQSFLKIKSIEKPDSGVYTCQASLLVDHSLQNKLFNITVYDIQDPVIIKSSLNNSVFEIYARDQLELSCVVSGRPLPTLQWLKDSQLWSPNKDDIERTVTDKAISTDVVSSILFIKHLRLDDSGRYSCQASNLYGQDERYIELEVKNVTSALRYILIIIAIVAVFIIATTYLVWQVIKERKKRKLLEEAGLGDLFYSGDPKQYDPNNLLQDQPNVLPYDKKWEFPRDKLKIGTRLGEGAFGVVWHAQARGITDAEATSDVAVKMAKNYASADEMLSLVSELKILMHLGKHINVVNLLGACTKNRKHCELFVIEEYCEFGNLENYMKKHRDVFIDLLKDNRRSVGKVNNGYSSSSDKSTGYVESSTLLPVTSDTIHSSVTTDRTPHINVSDLEKTSSSYEWRNNSLYSGREGKEGKRPLNTRDLLCWAFQVTRGMAYLHSRHVIHRDLATRNILLAADNVVKICDFGLSRNIYKSGNYKKESGGPVPWKWMALESLTEMKFTEHSDVWSFGIVMWEMFSLALTPYRGFQADDHFLKRLLDGYRLEMPEYADDNLHAIMLDCWGEDPKKRPTFPQLEKTISTFIDDRVRAHYIDLNSIYMEVNRSSSPPQEDYLVMIGSEHGYAQVSTDMSNTSFVAMSPSKGLVYYANIGKLPTDGSTSNVQQNDSYFLANDNESHKEDVTPMLSEKVIVN